MATVVLIMVQTLREIEPFGPLCSIFWVNQVHTNMYRLIPGWVPQDSSDVFCLRKVRTMCLLPKYTLQAKNRHMGSLQVFQKAQVYTRYAIHWSLRSQLVQKAALLFGMSFFDIIVIMHKNHTRARALPTPNISVFDAKTGWLTFWWDLRETNLFFIFPLFRYIYFHN